LVAKPGEGEAAMTMPFTNCVPVLGPISVQTPVVGLIV
jgi:hypothetical protein